LAENDWEGRMERGQNISLRPVAIVEPVFGAIPELL